MDREEWHINPAGSRPTSRVPETPPGWEKVAEIETEMESHTFNCNMLNTGAIHLSKNASIHCAAGYACSFLYDLWLGETLPPQGHKKIWGEAPDDGTDPCKNQKNTHLNRVIRVWKTAMKTRTMTKNSQRTPTRNNPTLNRDTCVTEKESLFICIPFNFTSHLTDTQSGSLQMTHWGNLLPEWLLIIKTKLALVLST